MTSGSRVPVAGRAGLFGRRMVEHMPGGNGEGPAADGSAARALGYQPVHDPRTGMRTAGPDFNHPGARAGRTRA